MGLLMRKPDFVACKQQRLSPASAFMQSDHGLYYTLPGKYNDLTGYRYMQFQYSRLSLCLSRLVSVLFGQNPPKRVFS